MTFSGNYIDLIILFVFLFFISEGYRHGFWVMLVDFVSFFLSLLVALWSYSYASDLLEVNFSFGRSLANALGFLFTALLAEAILGSLLARLLKKLPKKLFKTKWNRLLAVLPAAGEAAVLVSFGLTLLLSFPVAPKIKVDIGESRIGLYLVQQTSGIEAQLNEVFGGIIEDSLTYLTIKPQSRESISLTVEKSELSIDENSEIEMFRLVNEERGKRGAKVLVWDPGLVAVGRDHAKDMWERRYFGHVSPEGEDVGNRLEEAEIVYRFAGENLALAPTVSTAHMGLMNSEGHRENILGSNFGKVGVGVIDNGVYGKLFVQVFTD